MIIDRFEGKFAVIETDEGMKDVHISLLPENAEEGDVLKLEDGKYSVDREETAVRRAAAASRLRRLLRGGSDD